MSTYNTKGTGHRSYRKEFDTMYNRGYVWHSVLDNLVNDYLSKSWNLRLSRHVQEMIDNNTYGNREINKNDITLENMLKGEVVEAEFQFEDYEGEDFNCLNKVVIRLPEREDGEQIVVVCATNYNGIPSIKTAWLNKKADSHKTLDTRDFDWRLEGERFGYFHKGWTSRVWEINNDLMKELEPNKAMTIEEYNKRKNL